MHVDLHGHHSNNALHGVPNGEQDDENELHSHIENATLDDNSYYGSACHHPELHASHVPHLARGEVPYVYGDEGCQDHVRDQWKNEASEA